MSDPAIRNDGVDGARTGIWLDERGLYPRGKRRNGRRASSSYSSHWRQLLSVALLVASRGNRQA